MKRSALIFPILLILSISGYYNYASAAEKIDCTKPNLTETELASCCAWNSGFDRYQCYLKNICQKGEWYEKKDQLIKFKEPPYGKIEETGGKNFSKKYFEYMSGLGIAKEDVLSELNNNTIDTSQSTESEFLPIQTFDLAKLAYRETMNSIYKCSILNAKILTGKHILETKSADQSAISKKIKKEATQMEQQFQKLGCRKVIDQKSQDPSLKQQLLSSTTYQQCAYRFYLQQYLVDAYNNDYSSFLTNASSDPKKVDPRMKVLFWKINDTIKISNFFGAKMDEVSAEIEHSKRVYRQAFVSYNEFERTYELHLWLTIIFEDYINLRDNMKKLLNPIGQLIYKISNAQSPGK